MNTAVFRPNFHAHAPWLPHVPMWTWRRVLTPIVAGLLAMSLARSVGAQELKDSLTTAKDLYASAAYDEALTVLNRLRGSSLGSNDSANVEQVRALCLLALGRASEAERAIEEVITQQPMYQPSEAEASPRVRGAFLDVRKRMLPTIAQQQYALAKNAFEHKDYAAAVRLFKRTLEVLDDPAMNAKEPGIGDLRTLTTGFLELSVGAAAPPPLPSAAPAAPPPAAPATMTPSAPADPAPAPMRSMHYPGDPGVTAPITVRQDLPRWPLTQPTPGGRGVLEVVIDETGRVESAAMRQSVTSVYDTVLLAAAKGWRYRPAMKDGEPVRFRKLVEVTLEGRR